MANKNKVDSGSDMGTVHYDKNQRSNMGGLNQDRDAGKVSGTGTEKAGDLESKDSGKVESPQEDDAEID